MKHLLTFTAVIFVTLILCDTLLALSTTADDAEKVVTGWLKADPRPLDQTLGRQVQRVETFTNDNGEPVYYIVYLDPSGFVIVRRSG
jgi:hypothetical protein